MTAALQSSAPSAPPSDPPRVVFALANLENSQNSVLKAVLGDENYTTHKSRHDSLAVVGIYAKPLLGGLYVLSLLEKANLLGAQGASDLKPEFLKFISSAIAQFTGFLKVHYDSVADPNDGNKLWGQLVNEIPPMVSRLIWLYRDFDIPPPGAYAALYPLNIEAMNADPNLSTLGFHWLLLALACLDEGAHRKLWSLQLTLGAPGTSGQFSLIQPGGRALRIFVLRDPKGLADIVAKGFINSKDPDALIVYTKGRRQGRPQARKQTPGTTLPGRGRARKTPEFWIQDHAEGAATVDSLIGELELELI